MSPILFGIYIDELLYRLKHSGFGCKIGHQYYGALGYADDLSLVAPSLYGLNKMCNIALEYAKEYDIKFNPSKCQLLSFGSSPKVELNFDGECITNINKGIHLGHIIGPNVGRDVMQDASRTLIQNVNSVLHNFKFCSLDVKYKLFTSFCTSFYGSQIWNVDDKMMNCLYIAWRKSIRKLFNLPYTTHSLLLPIIANCRPIECQILSRIANFIKTTLSSVNDNLTLIMNIVVNGNSSNTGQSFKHLLTRCNMSSNTFINTPISAIKVTLSDVLTPASMHQAGGNFARELLYERERVGFNPISSDMSIEELTSMLTCVCTDQYGDNLFGVA